VAPPHKTAAGSVGRQILHLALPASEPLRLDKALAVLVQELVRGTDGAVADTSHVADLARALGLAEQVAGHVDACRGDGERGAAGEVAHGGYLVREALGDLDELLAVQAELGAEAQDEVYGVRRGRRLVRVRLREGAFTHHAVNMGE
jgi:hypothetical protein